MANLLGGFFASAVNWRIAFIAVGLAGVLLAPVFKRVVRERERRRYDTPGRTRAPAGVWRRRAGVAPQAVVPGDLLWRRRVVDDGYGLIFWMPSFFVRSYGLTLLEASPVMSFALFLVPTDGISITRG